MAGHDLSWWLGLVAGLDFRGSANSNVLAFCEVNRLRTELRCVSSRSGDAYLRTLLIQGASSSVQAALRVPAEKATPKQIWIRQLAPRLLFGQLLVAIANKHARQLWAMLARGVAYDLDAWIRQPIRYLADCLESPVTLL